jgi:hypothetical protein
VAARSAKDVWAVGWLHTTTDFQQQTYAQHWDGRVWSSVPTPNPPPSTRLPGSALTDVDVVGRSDAWAVGWHLDDEGYAQALTMRWDGARWSIVAVPPAPRLGDYRLYGVAAVSTSDVWAVGVSGGQPLLMHWDGATWRLWPAPTLSQQEPNRLYAVDARGARDAWAVGYSGTRKGIVPLALRWNGRRWRVVSRRGLKVNGELLGVAAAPKGAWVVGWHFPRRAAGEVALAARWNGRSWSKQAVPDRKYWDDRIEDVDITPSGVPAAVGVVAYDVDKKVDPVAFRWGRGRWRSANVEYAGHAAFWAVDVLSRSDGWAVGVGPSGVFTQRLSRCRP